MKFTFVTVIFVIHLCNFLEECVSEIVIDTKEGVWLSMSVFTDGRVFSRAG